MRGLLGILSAALFGVLIVALIMAIMEEEPLPLFREATREEKDFYSIVNMINSIF